MKYKQRLDTQDLFLGKAKQEDLECIFKNYWSSEISSKYMLWTPQKDLIEAQLRLDKTINFQKDHLAFFVYDKRSGEAIGQAGMIEIETDVYEDIGIGLGENFVRRGYGKQVLNCFIDYLFGELNAKKIICSCFADNIASTKLQQSCGLKYSYSKTATRQRDNLTYKSDYYEITKDDWLKNKTLEQ